MEGFVPLENFLAMPLQEEEEEQEQEGQEEQEQEEEEEAEEEDVFATLEICINIKTSQKRFQNLHFFTQHSIKLGGIVEYCFTCNWFWKFLIMYYCKPYLL